MQESAAFDLPTELLLCVAPLCENRHSQSAPLHTFPGRPQTPTAGEAPGDKPVPRGMLSPSHPSLPRSWRAPLSFW
jgi:hypothetical protein